MSEAASNTGASFGGRLGRAFLGFVCICTLTAGAVTLAGALVRALQWLRASTSTPSAEEARVAGQALLVLLGGTLSVVFVALVVAVPLGILGGLWLTSRPPGPFTRTIRAGLGIAAGLPAFALAAPLAAPLGGFLHQLDVTAQPRSAALAGLVLGIWAAPMLAILSTRAFATVPRDLVAHGTALGATPWANLRHLVLPTAHAEVGAAICLVTARLGVEVCAAAILTGGQGSTSTTIGGPVETLGGFVAKVVPYALDSGGAAYPTPFAAGALLLVWSWIWVAAGRFLISRDHPPGSRAGL